MVLRYSMGERGLSLYYFSTILGIDRLDMQNKLHIGNGVIVNAAKVSKSELADQLLQVLGLLSKLG